MRTSKIKGLIESEVQRRVSEIVLNKEWEELKKKVHEEVLRQVQGELTNSLGTDEEKKNFIRGAVDYWAERHEKNASERLHWSLAVWIRNTVIFIFLFFAIAWMVSVILHGCLWSSFSVKGGADKIATTSVTPCVCTNAIATTNHCSVGQMFSSEISSYENRNAVVIAQKSDDNFWEEFTKLYDLLRSELGEWLSILGIVITFFGVCVPIGSQLMQSRTFEESMKSLRERLADAKKDLDEKLNNAKENLEKAVQNHEEELVKMKKAIEINEGEINEKSERSPAILTGNNDQTELPPPPVNKKSERSPAILTGNNDQTELPPPPVNKKSERSPAISTGNNDQTKLPPQPEENETRVTVMPVATGLTDYNDLLEKNGSSINAFNYALTLEDVGFAEFLMPILRKEIPDKAYIDKVLTQVAAMGSDKAANELKSILTTINGADCPYSLAVKVDAIGSYVSYCNRRDLEIENLEFVSGLVNGALPSAKDDKKQMAQLHNQMQRLLHGAASTLGAQYDSDDSDEKITSILEQAILEAYHAIEFDPGVPAYKTNLEGCYKLLGHFASRGGEKAADSLKKNLRNMIGNDGGCSLQTRVEMIGAYVNYCNRRDKEREEIKFVNELVAATLPLAEDDKKLTAQLHNQNQRLLFGAAATLKNDGGDDKDREKLLEDAVREIKTAIGCDPEEPAYYYNCAGCYSELNKITEAIVEIETCVSKGTEDYDHYCLAYQLYGKHGDMVKRDEMAKKMKAINPHRATVDLKEKKQDD